MYCIFICRGAARQIEMQAAPPQAVLQKQTQRLSPDDRHLPKLILEADGFFPTSTQHIKKTGCPPSYPLGEQPVIG